MTTTTGGESVPDTSAVPYQLRAGATWLELTLPFLEKRGARSALHVRREVRFLRILADQIETETRRRIKNVLKAD